ncbi:MAG TPA: hypothetical protein VHH36_03645 [Candidatus Thermoplasmatota archaeon]|nr:hypothetical protein [Candidatus Thermoplasmatota archaeon]
MRTLLAIALIATAFVVAAPSAQAQPPICETRSYEGGGSISCGDGAIRACVVFHDGGVYGCSP